MKKVRILIADDHQLIRRGLAEIINDEPDLSVVGEAADGTEAIRLANTLKPDIIIMDLMMPNLNGVEATRQILTSDSKARILILTSFATSLALSQAVDAGAVGVMLKDSTIDEQLAAIRAVANGQEYFPPEITAILEENASVTKLSPRQLKILEAITRGYTNQDIATMFDISTTAVKQQLHTICRKIGAANRAEATSIALRKHLLK